MLRAALLLFVLSMVAAFLGFGGVSSDAASLARIAFVVFFAMAALSFLFGRKAKA